MFINRLGVKYVYLFVFLVIFDCSIVEISLFFVRSLSLIKFIFDYF